MLSAVPNIISLAQGEDPHIIGGIGVGVWYGKSGCSDYKSCNISETGQVQKLLLTAYINSHTRYQWLPKCLTLNDLQARFNFFVTDFHEIHSVIYCTLSLWSRQLPLKYQTKQLPAHSISIKINSCIVRFLCNSTACLFLIFC